jgi:hypothetical protein
MKKTEMMIQNENWDDHESSRHLGVTVSALV